MNANNTLLQFGRGVERLRRSVGLTQQALSERCGRFKGRIPSIESGTAIVTLDMVLVLAQALEVDPVTLLMQMDPAETAPPRYH